MIRHFLTSAAARATLRDMLKLMAGSATLRAIKGFALGYLLLGTVDLMAGLGLLVAYGLGVTGTTALRDKMELRLAALAEDFSSTQQKRVLRCVMDCRTATMEAFGPEKILAQLEQTIRVVLAFDRAFNDLIGLVATLAVVLMIAVILSPGSGLVALGVISVAGLLYFVNRKVLGRRAAQMTQAARAYRDGISDLVLGFKELKLSPVRAQRLLRETLRPASKSLGRERAYYQSAAALNQVFAELIALLAAGATAAVAAVLMPDDRLSAGISAIALILLPTYALRALPDSMQLHEMLAALDETLAALPSDPAPVSPAAATPIVAFGDLHLDEVSFRAAGGTFVLGPLSCDVELGAITFLTGGNGSGKSTLLRLMCGLTSPDSGQAYIGGRPVWLPAQRHLFSAVFADVHLFDRLYGLPLQAEAAVNAWLQRLGMQGVTRVERGRFTKLDLSTGQRKRVALAVALAERRPVLMLDEWAADQDPESRRFFYLELLPELRAAGRTIIAVSHDDRYFHVADRLLKLQDGQIVQGAVLTPA